MAHAMWLIASLLPVILGMVWAVYGWMDMVYLMLMCAGTLPWLALGLAIAILVLWFQPSDKLFAFLMWPLLCAYYWVVGVDPNDPDLDEPSEESGEGEASEESGEVVTEDALVYYLLSLGWAPSFGEDEGEGEEEEEACSNSEDDNVSSEHTEFW